MVWQKMFTRTPERRKTRRQNSAGRRSFNRFVLESEVVVGVTFSGGFFSTANLLDISLSGAYVLLGCDHSPVINQIIEIDFSEIQFNDSKQVKACIKYVNNSLLLGGAMYGIGVEFLDLLPDGFVAQSSETELIVAGTRIAMTVS